MMNVYIDGGARGNPGPAAVGFVVFDGNSNEVYRFGQRIGTCTNNCAEYTALVEALKYLNERGDGTTAPFQGNERVTLHSDSELLVRQINGTYRVRDPKLIPLYRTARKLLDGGGDWRIVHVSRRANRTADAIVNRVLDGLDLDI
jgi:ribonuclease HI